ncbi:MAG: hypothetical protein KC422_22335 [Trueperaceae bacterium]|nr:hypothetical protein [Trueperaceae bacterium]
MKNTMQSLKKLVIMGGVLLLAFLVLAQAQFMDMSSMVYGNMAFDQQMFNQIGGMMSANQQQITQLMQSAANDPQVQSAYYNYMQQTGQQLSYEQFVYYYIMTAGGTNSQAGLQAQQNMFNGLQQANATLQSGYASQNQGWWENQATLDQTMQRYGDMGINGNAYYSDPNSGQVYTLPYTSGSSYYQTGQESFYMDNLGQYWQLQGNNWVQLYPYGQ